MKALYRLRSLLSLAFSCAFISASAAAPAEYYKNCENKGGETLLKALYETISSHRNVGYDGLWNVYRTSDVKANGKIWDMYSTKEWPVGSQQCGSYKLVGDCYNREHSFPKSWFSKGSPMVSDAFHIYPTDGKVNGQRSNHPYGECANGTTLPSNGSVHALGRLGSSTTPGYTGTVFEPDDQYKGDFARSYFYMAACYYDKIRGWDSPMLAGNSYPAFSKWAIDLLLKWHRQDPVSEKEIKRNDAVYAHQNNRNPFIDHPELAEYVWGKNKNDLWGAGAAVTGQINRPVDGSSVNIGSTALGHPISATISVKGTDLTDNITLTSSSADFTLSPTSVSASDANSANGTSVKVTFTPSKIGNATATLTLRSGSISSRITLNASAVAGLPVMSATDIEETAFTARWTYVGDELPGGFYRLSVYNEDESESVGTFDVTAATGSYRVTGLTPATLYSYSLASASLTSDDLYVTTATPVPMVSFYYDGDLSLSAEPGVPSEAAELLVEIENIDTDVTIEVDSPFELSTDRSNWSTSIVLSPDEDRCYLRVNSDKAGTFITSLTATAGTYVGDDSSVEAIVAAETTFLEDFEAESELSGYDGGDYLGKAAKWYFYNTGIFPSSSEAYEGQGSARFGKQDNSYIEMSVDKPRGIGTVEFQARRWSSTDGDATVELLYSTDHGQSWTSAGTTVISSDDYKPYTFTVNRTGNIRIRLLQIAGKRFNVDNISATDYEPSGATDPVADYHAWDAFCRDGALVITVAAEAQAAVYGVDGITYHNDTVSSGETILNVPAGLYVVAVGDFTRRVLVKK